MTNDEKDTAEPGTDAQSPFTRPGFVVSAAIVGLIVVLGAVVVVRAVGSTPPSAPPPVSSSASATPSTTSGPGADKAASVCGLPAGSGGNFLDSPPAVRWMFQRTIAYPSSPEFGAGKAAAEGYRYCFQHSPAGAVVMAANALAQGSDPQTGTSWSEYVLGQGRYRAELADQLRAATGTEGSRLKIAGFRLLSYDGTAARVDLGIQGSSQNQTLTVSGVYELVWQEGDWKISADIEQPLDVSSIDSLNGYVPWGE